MHCLNICKKNRKRILCVEVKIMQFLILSWLFVYMILSYVKDIYAVSGCSKISYIWLYRRGRIYILRPMWRWRWTPVKRVSICEDETRGTHIYLCRELKRDDAWICDCGERRKLWMSIYFNTRVSDTRPIDQICPISRSAHNALLLLYLAYTFLQWLW